MHATQSRQRRAIGRTPATAKPTSTRQPTTPRPLTYQAIAAWHEWQDRGARQGKSKIDARLLTLDEPFSSLLAGMVHPRHADATLKAAAEAFARQVVKVPPVLSVVERRRYEARLTAVVCDWMVRCALARYFDRLPDWCRPHASAERLRQLHGLQWTETIVRAISELTAMWIYLEDAHRDRGTADERTAIVTAHAHAGEALALTTHLLTLQWQYKHNEPGFLCHMAMHLTHDWYFVPEPAVVETLPALAAALCAIRPGDSQRSVSERCVWPGPVAEAVADETGGAR